MEYLDELKALTVRIENGSGVLVRPLSDEYDYILTAHHVVKLFDEGNAKDITVSFLPHSPYKDVKVDITGLKKREDMDAAVIIIRKIEKDICFVYPKKALPNDVKGWHLGYPNNQNDKGTAANCVEHEIRNWLGSFDNVFVKYQCEQTINKNEIEGMSGGGIFDTDYHLLGVHSKFAADDEKEQLSKFVMIPWVCFENIIKAHGLRPVMPFDLATLKPFKEHIFCFEDNIGARIKLKSLLAQLAVLKASIEDWSPKNCYEAFQQYRNARKYVLTEQMEENDWVMFGEFLVAMKILLKGINKVEDIFPHFQFVQSDRNFDIYDVDNQLDPGVLGKVADEDVVFVIGGIDGKGYQQDVRPKNIVRINDSREPGSKFDIARLGKDVFGAFTFVNGSLFKEAMKENSTGIQDSDADCEDYYKQLLSESIWPKKKNSAKGA